MVGDERVAGAIGAVEAGRIALRERADQGAHPVGIGQRERLVAEQTGDHVDGVRPLRHGLQREPLVDHQGVVAPPGVEVGERLVPLGQVALGEQAERRDHIGHVVGAPELGKAPVAALRAAARQR